tara:strand:- start:462 stop:623 length:162 start_codon:yes stop_codon:yes gene_type:complete
MSRLSQAGGCDIPNSGRSKEDARKDDNIKIAALDGFYLLKGLKLIKCLESKML